MTQWQHFLALAMDYGLTLFQSSLVGALWFIAAYFDWHPANVAIAATFTIAQLSWRPPAVDVTR